MLVGSTLVFLVLIISIAHMIYIRCSFLLSLGDRSLKYYANFCGSCCKPISSGIQVIKCQRERLFVGRLFVGRSISIRFTFILYSICSQLLGEPDLPPLNEVFSCLRQAFVSDAPVSQLPTESLTVQL